MQPGQEIKEGDVLVQLDKTSFELDVAMATARVEKAKADLAKLIAGNARIDRPHEGRIGRGECSQKVG